MICWDECTRIWIESVVDVDAVDEGSRGVCRAFVFVFDERRRNLNDEPTFKTSTI